MDLFSTHTFFLNPTCSQPPQLAPDHLPSPWACVLASALTSSRCLALDPCAESGEQLRQVLA